jgi:D-alanyl-D-alanine carboxypeptidase/D-alanyl-D-alanine carboxypeptidase (penicillin-binding protein 5/6)
MINSLISSAKGCRSARIVTSLFIISCILYTCLFSRSFAVEESTEPKTEAVSALLFDARRGQVIFSKTSDEVSHSPLANRIMTTLITLEKADTEAMVTASKDAANTEGATLKLTVGEKYPVKNLLSAFLLTGSPDAAKAVAEYVGGSEKGFVKIMNEYASKLNMSDTYFTNSTGSYDKYQYTSMNDIAVLLKYALSNSDFNRFFGTQAKPWYDETKTLLLTNTNNMFWNYPDTDGGITASFDKDLQSIVTTVTKNNMRLVCLLLDVPTKSMYTDSISLLNYGFDNYLYGTLVSAGSSQQVTTVEGQSLNLVPSVDVHYIYPKGHGQDFIKDVAINVDNSKLKPPLTKSTIVGMLTFTLADETVINVELYPDREILPQKTTAQLLKEQILESRELIYVIMLLIVIEVIIGIINISRSIKKQIIKARAKSSRHIH